MSSKRGNGVTRVPRIVLTGGIASGKSTVAKLFEALGAKLIDTDRIARDIVAPPSTVLDRIVARFGPEVLLANGALDRSRLRQIVFADPEARRDLEGITHPAIHDEVIRISEHLGGPYQLVAVPLLVETGTQGNYDRVLLVDASPRIQKLRLMVRDGVDGDTAERMLAAQATREARRAAAHDIIQNDGDLDSLRARVEELHHQYLSLGSQTGDS